MTKRTVTSKGLHVKMRTLYKINVSLHADLKACRIQLRKVTDERNDLQAQLDSAYADQAIAKDGEYTVPCTDEVQVDEIIAAAKETDCGQDS